MTVTIDPSDMRPPTARPPKRTRLAVRQVLLAGIGLCALAGFTAGAFSFFSGLADPRAKTARPISVASSWPDLKDGVPALTPRSTDASGTAATILNLPRPDEVDSRRNAASGTDFQLRDARPAEPPSAKSEALPPASEAGSKRTSAPASSIAAAQPAEGADAPSPVASVKVASARSETAASEDAARPPAKQAASAPARAMPPIENAEPVAGEIKSVPVLAPTRTASAIAPSRSETIRAKSAEPSTFVSLPPEPSPAEPAAMRADPPKPAAAKAAAAKPAPVKPKPVQAAPAKPPVQKPIMQASAAPVPAQAAPAREADDPEVMGVKIPGGRHVRDGWKAVFGGGAQPN